MLGISPGLHACSYCVLAYHGSAALADPIDADVLHGGRRTPGRPFDVGKHAWVHHMILAIVCERNPPLVVAFGPACDPREPQEHVDAVKTLVHMLSMTVGATVIDLSDKRELRDALHVSNDRGIRPAVCAGIRGKVQTRDRRILLATAAALGGGARRHLAGQTQGGIAAALGAPS